MDLPLRLSPTIEFENWETAAALQAQAADHMAEGFMFKRRGSPYGVGRRRGDWWKWKVDPHHIDAVLIYAQRGSGRRASLYTDYTFGVWDEGKLVPVAKAYSGLTDAEIREVDAFVRRNTVDRFGPVRVVKPEMVFELAFERVQASTRHKAGVAVRFPRMARWRKDKPAAEADTLETLKGLIRHRDVPMAEPAAARRAPERRREQPVRAVRSRRDEETGDLFGDLSDR
jgi:DNA ligase-1